MSLRDHLPLKDRQEAGQLLAAELDSMRDAPDLLVLGLPRGGVPVAWEIARALHAPMDVFVVRKVGLPWHPEYAVGAIASGGIQVLDPEAARMLGPEQLLAVVRRETDELQRREIAYREGRPPLHLQDRSVLLVDDGIATGATMEAAVAAVRKQHPRMLAVATPVGSASAAQRLRPKVDLLVFGAEPEPFTAVSLWYRAFPQTTDEEVTSLLATAQASSLAH